MNHSYQALFNKVGGREEGGGVSGVSLCLGLG
jgi:hypothetical protein